MYTPAPVPPTPAEFAIAIALSILFAVALGCGGWSIMTNPLIVGTPHPIDGPVPVTTPR